LAPRREPDALSQRRPTTRETPKKFGARVEAVFSARFTVHTGQIANPLTMHTASCRFRDLPGLKAAGRNGHT
jgi:hypothetical protein